MPLRPEFSRDVRKRVDAESVETGRFRPPDTVLDEVFDDERIFCIQVGQNAEKPAIR